MSQDSASAAFTSSPAPSASISSSIAPQDSASFWDRITTWASEHKAVVYTIAGVTVVATGAGIYYYSSASSKGTNGAAPSDKKKSKNKRKNKKAGEEKTAEDAAAKKPEPAKVEQVEEEQLPEIDENIVTTMSEQERKDAAAKLKAAGNKAYGSKDYNRAINLYGKAILCRADPVFYSNRAACWNMMSNWDRVIEDTTAAINIDNEYVKALNRRANAYEQSGKFSLALLDYTASCIIDSFRNDSSAASVERLLKKVAEEKGRKILAEKEKKLPSPTFVTNYLQSFRPKPPPKGLEETAELDENTGKGQLQKGIQAMTKKTGDGYTEADAAFEKALELGDLGEYEAFAYNMRGTFKYLKGENEAALDDLNRSVEFQPSLTQSFIKKASMNLELGKNHHLPIIKDAAAQDFETAMQQDESDPDIYYHRAQLNFILNEFSEAAKDYHKSIDLDKDFIFSHIQLGVTQYKMGSLASSMATFRRCVKNFDKVPDVYNYYGELLLDQQKYQEAIEKFDTAVEMEKQTKPLGMNVLPLINKALALFQWKQDFAGAEELCQKALIIDPECDIAVATMAQLLLQQGKVTEALKYFERAAELSRTEGEVVNALSYAEATRTQLEVQEKYPQLANRLQNMGPGMAPAPVMR
ncbi:MAG: TOM (translocase of outer membrane) complex component [Bogoriella megaspora]|nr:MAG: TOM (translocase of outer membrane) complex component [Bogoriella megaspora]